MRKGRRVILLFLSALLLSGCAGRQADEPAPSAPPAAAKTAERENGSPLAAAAEALLLPYEEELAAISRLYPDTLTYTIPGGILRQMVSDAQETGAEPAEGRYRFTWRQSGNYSYENTAEEAMEGLGVEAAAPDPADEAPMDSQLNGDYAVSGGGLFERTRTYDVREDMTEGKTEIADSLNGVSTGYETFSFALRGNELYFADAVLDLIAGMDGLSLQEGYLASVGVLRPDSAELLEYHIADLSQLPDPATMDWDGFASSVDALTRITARGEEVHSAP